MNIVQQKLMLKRLKKKSEIPTGEMLAIDIIHLNNQQIKFLRSMDDRYFFFNMANCKWYELKNKIWEIQEV